MGQYQMLLSIIIPVYNEELTIGNIIDRTKEAVRQLGLETEIIVVDDCSHDNSLLVASQRNVKVCTLKQHLGKGYALRAGFAKARGDLIVTIDSDGSHWPEELHEVVAPVFCDQADMVIGSRYMNRKRVEARKLNKFGVYIFNSLIALFTGVAITDSQSGYRAMKREVLLAQKLTSGEYEIESEMLVKAVKAGFRVAEVPITFEQRTYGHSGVDPMVDGSKILLSIIRAYLKV
ncbi:glycosyltransferase family 2 protein [Candidatus Bathycorpusculum sp.]|uniref:glycosyltransferase family 2 protein n=1 Tax=Candidatus Bathycorpusculum sp. TaxID=2994959 RepID=UPI00281D924E|nr:glycosyltransferase family 2 protein [Candidatus Termitimicrobium sp.]MCL2686635.1 glycosyltransferase family 2 protein [Candidatus Termitimicrobium sp.]